MSVHFAIKTGRVAAGGTLLIGGIAGALVLAPQAGAATTYHVTNTADSGAGSLRQAIDGANNNPGADIIVFDAISAGTITLTSGQLAITDDVNITGLGATDSIISGNNNSRIFYIYGSYAADLAVSISGLTMTDGYGLYDGGAIFNKGNDLTLSSVVITGNEAKGKGGGVHSLYSNASLTITDSEISNNTAANLGGGLSFQSMGNVTITDTMISDNTAGNLGGGLSLYLVGDVTIASTVISGNTAVSNGSGAYVNGAGAVSIDSLTFDGNTGGVAAFYASDSTSFTMTNSLVSHNESANRSLAFNRNGDVLIANSTIANNSVSAGSAQILNFDILSGVARILQSTIAGNTATGAGPINWMTVKMQTFGTYSAEITGTIISDNSVISGSFTNYFDFWQGTGSVTVTNSLVMGATSQRTPLAAGGNTGNIVEVSAQLGALADNGGATFTMKPAVGSPVIDAGPLTWTQFAGDGFDQRGTPFVRVHNGQSDMGAFEVQPDPTATTITTTTTATTTTTTTTTTTAPSSTTTTTAPSSISTTLLGPIDTTTTLATDPVVPAFTG